MASYENVLIFTGSLPLDEVKNAIGSYRELVQSLGGEIVHEDFWGLKPLAYQINKQSTGYYVVTEFKAPSASIARLEVLYKRDERILRFLTVSLDKFALDYNERKRNGLIGKKKEPQAVAVEPSGPTAEQEITAEVFTVSNNPENTPTEA